MPDEKNSLSRRSILRRSGMVAGGLAVGTATFTGQAVADGHCSNACLCWMDVKPNSCPNSVNPDSSGVLPVTVGWPHFELDSVELFPVNANYVPDFDECQDWTDPVYDDNNRDSDTARELCELVADTGRSAATPFWMRTEDVDNDGDPDAKFKFLVEDLDLRSGDNFLVLKGESTKRGDDCTFYAIDSVRVLDGGNNGESSGRRSNGNGNGNGRGN